MRAVPFQSDLLDDMEPTKAVDHVNQAAIIDGDIICANSVTARLGVGLEMSYFFRRVRIGYINQANAAGEPGERDDRAGDDFAGLMAPGEHPFGLTDQAKTVDLPGTRSGSGWSRP